MLQVRCTVDWILTPCLWRTRDCSLHHGNHKLCMFGENGNAAVIGGIQPPVLNSTYCNTKASCDRNTGRDNCVQVVGHRVLPPETSSNKVDGSITPTQKLRPLCPSSTSQPSVSIIFKEEFTPCLCKHQIHAHTHTWLFFPFKLCSLWQARWILTCMGAQKHNNVQKSQFLDAQQLRKILNI